MKRNKNFEGKEPLLYLVATPIGNLKEMTPRALEILADADIIAAEDTRNSFALLEKFSIRKEMFSLREHNENQASEHLISLLKQGKKIAYISDAGYPGISDPGYLLVKNAKNAGIKVSTVAGSSAFLAALVSSGLPTNHFYFYGFLPVKNNEAISELENLKSFKDTLIFYESPHRIHKTLCTLYDVLGNREAVIGRELTKINEEFISGTLEELTDIDEVTLKGEMVIVIKGNDEVATIDDKEALNTVNELIGKGLTTKDAIEVSAKIYKINKNVLYNKVHKK